MIMAVKRENNMRRHDSSERGFTVLEILVVVVSIFISVAVAIFITQG